MSIRIRCSCGKQLQAKDELAGKRVKCPQCGQVIPVPKTSTPKAASDDEWDFSDTGDSLPPVPIAIPEAPVQQERMTPQVRFSRATRRVMLAMLPAMVMVISTLLIVLLVSLLPKDPIKSSAINIVFGILVFGMACGFLGHVIVLVVSIWKLFILSEYEGWYCLVPIYNQVILHEIAGFSPWWILVEFFCFPVTAVMYFLIWYVIAQNFRRSSNFAVALGLLPFIFLPVLIFGYEEKETS